MCLWWSAIPLNLKMMQKLRWNGCHNCRDESIAVVCHMNVVAHMAEILTSESFHPYHLAEARIYEQAVILAEPTQIKSFIPNA